MKCGVTSVRHIKPFDTIESLADDWGVSETASVCSTVKAVCIAAISGCTACFQSKWFTPSPSDTEASDVFNNTSCTGFNIEVSITQTVLANLENFISNSITISCPLDKMRSVVYSRIVKDALK